MLCTRLVNNSSDIYLPFLTHGWMAQQAAVVTIEMVRTVDIMIPHDMVTPRTLSVISTIIVQPAASKLANTTNLMLRSCLL